MRFVALDGLRGTCALIVALLHFTDYGRLTPGPFIDHSYVFVDFFFVLSGFVIAHAFYGDLDKPLASATFMLRRFGRLYPLHLFVLALWLGLEVAKWLAVSHGAVAAVAPFVGRTSPEALVSNLLLAQSLGLHDRLTWNYPSWSISVEFYTYLIFALVMLAVASLGPRVRMAAIATGIALGAVGTLWLLSRGNIMTYDTGIVRCVYGFFTGVLVQRLYAERASSGRRLGKLTGSLLELTTIALILVYEIYGEMDRLLFFAPLMFGFATFVFAEEAGVVSDLLKSRPFRALGDWSYSIYMVHAFVLINLVGRGAAGAAKLFHIDLGTLADGDGGTLMGALYAHNGLSAAGLVAAYVAATLAASSLTFRYVEVPSRTFFNRLASRLYRRRAMPAAA
ncbi:MAG: acyltransferase [Ancalomicrobiaceae bacterium]|nr:acyltransferase [Ancalomicrobiaceae bacterium]